MTVSGFVKTLHNSSWASRVLAATFSSMEKCLPCLCRRPLNSSFPSISPDAREWTRVIMVEWRATSSVRGLIASSASSKVVKRSSGSLSSRPELMWPPTEVI